MPRTFTDWTNASETGTKSAVRALQAWIFLIAKAQNRQLVRYDQLAEVMGYTDNRPLRSILGWIMTYCTHHNLPPLTILVVNKDGTPGSGFTDVVREEFDRKREDVFRYEWYKLVPPTVNEFGQASTIADGSS